MPRQITVDTDYPAEMRARIAVALAEAGALGCFTSSRRAETVQIIMRHLGQVLPLGGGGPVEPTGGGGPVERV